MSKTTFYHSADPIIVRTRSGSKATLPDLCKSVTPACHLNPLLFNGHLQTSWTAVNSTDIPVYYKRKIFTAENDACHGTFAVDFVVDEYQETKERMLLPRTCCFSDEELKELELGSLDDEPMLVALHGLSGGSHEIYIRHVIAPMVNKERGWKACVVNARGCAMSKITSPVLFNARATWDIRQVVKWLRKLYPNRSLFAIGFSLGANILTNYLGEEGSNCILKGAVVCSNPWNLEVSSLALQRSWLGLGVYSKVMASNMKRLFEIHIEEISKNPQIDVDKVRGVRYLHEFDRSALAAIPALRTKGAYPVINEIRVVQCPSWGYPTEGAYYRDASSSDSVLAVRVPLFVLNAEDDPIAAREAIPFEEIKQNPYVVLCASRGGGHIGWFEFGGGRWFAKPDSFAGNWILDKDGRISEPWPD
ncbi:hypothetical protein GP486_000200 [Trichoglossum hirsutum]|uniref:AB hydrolase-1 domain-containing protein n=1 Tax=Trichoglossum hirsutum TaxID=265104 RepID=A0A9P8RU54_9PEZI|nr:hypothetical protein GP486_000200 [Trichoglossum hirsutum]